MRSFLAPIPFLLFTSVCVVAAAASHTPQSQSTGSLPRISVVDGRVQYTFTRMLNATGIRYSVESSTDLKNWKPVEGAIETYEFTENGDAETVTVELTSAHLDNEQLFLRLSLSLSTGETWIIRHRQPHGKTLLAVVGGDNRLVAVGDGIAMHSSDGKTWQHASSSPDDYLRDIVWGKGTFVAVGSGIQTSPDGETWTERYPQTQLQSIIWTGAEFVAVGDQMLVLTSPNGIHWTEIHKESAPYATPQFHDIVWNGTKFVAIGGKPLAHSGWPLSPAIWTSLDGADWTPAAIDTSGDNPPPWDEDPSRALHDVEWAQELGLFVAVGDGFIFTSSNGDTWTRRPFQLTVQAIAWDGTDFRGIGGDRSYWDRKAIYSTDGFSWHEGGLLPDKMRSISWTSEQWIAVGENETVLTKGGD